MPKRPQAPGTATTGAVAAATPIRYPAAMQAPPTTLATDLQAPPERRAARLEMVANISPAARRALAMTDLLDGLRLYRLSSTLGWLDIKLRYRGSILGPFWLTLSTGVMILAMGVLYSRLFRMSLQEYMPYLAISIVLWNTVAAAVSDSCVCFTSAEGTIRATRLPFTIYAMRSVIRNLLVLAHNVVVIVLVIAFYGVWPGATALASVPGLVLWLIDGVAACLLLGTFCARFRDIPPIVGSIMQIAFFLTPIIWRPELIGENVTWLLLNPFYPLVALVRDPLLNIMPAASVWVAAVVWSGLLVAAAGLVFGRLRGRLAFWV